jgi:hypothetical protein
VAALPKGVEPNPGTGRHRRFTPAQAYHLALALKINDAGVNLPLAGQIAACARVAQEAAVTLGWDHEFAPFLGMLTAAKHWQLEVGNGRLVRIVTDANPSHRGWYRFPWTDMETHQSAPQTDTDIAVIIQVDLVHIARLLSSKQTTPPPAAAKQRRRAAHRAP